MPVTSLTIKPLPDSVRRIVDEAGNISLAFLFYLMNLVNSFTLFTGDTTAGNFTQPLPLAASLPNQEVFAIKISADGNTFSLDVALGSSDKINKQGAWGASNLVVGTVQGAAARLKSDGNSNWYVI